jgi:hypothetical protein
MGSCYAHLEQKNEAMSVKKKQKVDIINLSSNDLSEVESRLTSGLLTESDKKIILSIMATYQWLYNQLQTAKFSMHRLKKMFGFKTERMSSTKKNYLQDLPEQDGALQDLLSLYCARAQI